MYSAINSYHQLVLWSSRSHRFPCFVVIPCLLVCKGSWTTYVTWACEGNGKSENVSRVMWSQNGQKSSATRCSSTVKASKKHQEYSKMSSVTNGCGRSAGDKSCLKEGRSRWNFWTSPRHVAVNYNPISLSQQNSRRGVKTCARGLFWRFLAYRFVVNRSMLYVHLRCYFHRWVS